MIRHLATVGYLCLFLGFTIAGTDDTDPESSKRPHIIMVVIDDLGWSDVDWHNPSQEGCGSNRRGAPSDALVTPRLSQLVQEGIKMEQAYAQPKCSPSRAALLTGRYPFRMGMQRGSIGPYRPSGLPTRYKLLPQYLNKLGYVSRAVGKWHLGYCHQAYTPTLRGFKSFYGSYTEKIDHYNRIHDKKVEWIDPGYDLWENLDMASDNSTYSSQLYADKAEQIIKSHDKESPLFLYLAFSNLHTPLQVPRKYWEPLTPVKSRSNPNYRPSKAIIRQGMIYAVDEAVGRVADALKSSNLGDNYIMVVMSDNGSGFSGANCPLRGGKGTVYEGGTRVVSLVSSPLIPPHRRGTVFDGLFHVVDWAPTLLAAAGGDGRRPGMDGIDQWQRLRWGAGSRRARRVMVYNIDEDKESGMFQFAVRKGNWKLVWGSSKELNSKHPAVDRQVRLYNLKEDPYERKNMAAKRPGLVRSLKKKVQNILVPKMRQAFQPYSSVFGFPQYNNNRLSPGWCSAQH